MPQSMHTVVLAFLSAAVSTMPAAADIIHVVPPPNPATEHSFTPVPGGPTFIMTGGLGLWAPTARVSDHQVGAWVGSPGGEEGGIAQLWRLDAGDYIGPGGRFGSPISFTASGLMPVYGFSEIPEEFPAALTRLYGFAALTDGGFRYGWVEVQVLSPAPFDWTAIDVTQYAYESMPGAAIAAGAIPAPGAAALLVLSTLALRGRRDGVAPTGSFAQGARNVR